MENWYRLNKEELSHLSAIEEPVISVYSGKRLSTPVVVVMLGNKVVSVWTLRWYKREVRSLVLNTDLKYEIHAMY